MTTYTINKIRNDFRVLKELHGNVDESVLYSSLQNMYPKYEMNYLEFAVTSEVKPRNVEYGMVIGRFQPFHFGHQHIINEILLDGKVPIVVLGDDNGECPEKNPLSFNERIELIRQVYPSECFFVHSHDNEDWDIWFKEIEDSVLKIANTLDEVTLYYYNKEEDRYDYFYCNEREYFNEFYTIIFDYNGFKMKEVEFVDRSDIHIDANARDIRSDFCEFKHLMDGRNFWALIEKGWCSCGKHQRNKK